MTDSQTPQSHIIFNMRQRSLCENNHQMTILELGIIEHWLCKECKKIYTYKIGDKQSIHDAGDLVV